MPGRHDGKHRRIVKLRPDGSDWARTDLYYTPAWQVLEERADDGIDTANKDTPVTDVRYQYVWDTRYVDALVCRSGPPDLAWLESRKGLPIC